MGVIFIYLKQCFELLHKEWALRARSNAPIACKFSPSYGPKLSVGVIGGVLMDIASKDVEPTRYGNQDICWNVQLAQRIFSQIYKQCEADD